MLPEPRSPNITTHDHVQRLAQEQKLLKLYDLGTASKLEDKFIEKLRHYPRPLFVGQANYLKEKALGRICYVWESEGVQNFNRAKHSEHGNAPPLELGEERLSPQKSRISERCDRPPRRTIAPSHPSTTSADRRDHLR